MISTVEKKITQQVVSKVVLFFCIKQHLSFRMLFLISVLDVFK